MQVPDNFGSGADGPLHVTSNTTLTLVDSVCTGTATSQSLSATNASFAAGRMIFIIQLQGTGVGNKEFNYIDSYVAGTITTVLPLENTYAAGAVVIQMPQYSSLTIDAGVTLSGTAWNGTKFGYLPILVSGKSQINGTYSTKAMGYRGGAVGLSQTAGTQGEGKTGVGSASTSANNDGGGGGKANSGTNSGGAGGGGGYGTAGTAGSATPGDTGGAGGAAKGSADLTSGVFLGGGGGGGGMDGGFPGTAGKRGGGINILISKEIEINTTTGLIDASGESSANTQYAPGGNGAGGTNWLISEKIKGGTNRIIASGGSGGVSTDGSIFYGAAGPGGAGRNRLEACDVQTTTTNPADSRNLGGQDFCQSFIHIY